MTATQLQQDHPKHVIILTDHPSIPCAKYYEDVFDTIIVECRHPEHNQLLSLLNEKGESDELSPKPDVKNNPSHTTTQQSIDVQEQASGKDQEGRLV